MTNATKGPVVGDVLRTVIAQRDAYRRELASVRATIRPRDDGPQRRLARIAAERAERQAERIDVYRQEIAFLRRLLRAGQRPRRDAEQERAETEL